MTHMADFSPRSTGKSSKAIRPSAVRDQRLLPLEPGHCRILNKALPRGCGAGKNRIGRACGSDSEQPVCSVPGFASIRDSKLFRLQRSALGFMSLLSREEGKVREATGSPTSSAKAEAARPLRSHESDTSDQPWCCASGSARA